MDPIHSTDRIDVEFPLAGKNANGTVATLTTILLAVLPVDAKPSKRTVWRSVTFTGGTVKFIAAGVDADATGAFVVRAPGGDAYARATGGSRSQAVKVGRIPAV